MTGKLLVVYLIAVTVDAEVFDVSRMALTLLGFQTSFSNPLIYNLTSINTKAIEC